MTFNAVTFHLKQFIVWHFHLVSSSSSRFRQYPVKSWTINLLINLTSLDMKMSRTLTIPHTDKDNSADEDEDDITIYISSPVDRLRWACGESQLNLRELLSLGLKVMYFQADVTFKTDLNISPRQEEYFLFLSTWPSPARQIFYLDLKNFWRTE